MTAKLVSANCYSMKFSILVQTLLIADFLELSS
jgi:hypothetical protein